MSVFQCKHGLPEQLCPDCDPTKGERVSDSSPDAWLHIMDNTEGLSENEPMKVLTFSEENPFGVAGSDYDETFTVTSIPLYRRTARRTLAGIRQRNKKRTKTA